MNEINAPLAGEMSGHIFFKERWYGFDDALYTAARFIEIFSNSKKKPAPSGENVEYGNTKLKLKTNKMWFPKLIISD